MYRKVFTPGKHSIMQKWRRLGYNQVVFVFESLFAGFYVVVTRSITPIFLVATGYTLQDLLIINAIAGTLALLIGVLLYKYASKSVSKHKLVVAHVTERIMWFLIPFGIGSKEYIALLYGLALASTLPTSVFLQTTMLSTLDEEAYRKTLMLRGVTGGISSIIGQLTTVFTLMATRSLTKYYMLYQAAFIVGLISSITILMASFKGIVKGLTLKAEEEVEVKATNIYLLLVVLLTASTLLNISWVPRIMRDLGAPDYIAALIGFTQTLTNIFSSIFWIRQDIKSYRYAIMSLSLIPLLVYFTPIPLLHIVIAIIYSFSFVGTSLYAAIAYSSLVKKLGVMRAGILLSSASSFATVLAGLTGYILSSSTFLVFLGSSIYGLLGLSIALVSIPELAIVKPAYTRVYSRILYYTSVTGYSLTIYSLGESAKLTLKFSALVISLLILFIIYKTLYYIILLTRGG